MKEVDYFQSILNLLGGRPSTLSSLMGMLWQVFYAVVGCVIGAVVLGHYGAMLGTCIGGWMGFRSVHPYHSLLNQLNRLDDGQKRVLTDDIRRLVGSSTVENLLKYVVTGNGQQMVFGLIQSYLKNQTATASPNSSWFSRVFS